MYFLLDIDDCASNPCQNGAVCSDGINSYVCACVNGFVGINCETSVAPGKNFLLINNTSEHVTVFVTEIFGELILLNL